MPTFQVQDQDPAGARMPALWMTLHRLPEEWAGLEVWTCKLPIRVIYIFNTTS